MSIRTVSSSSGTGETKSGVLSGSETSENIGLTPLRYREESATSSQRSVVATGTPYDTVSIATTTNTGFTNVTANTSASQQQVTRGNIPIIRPPLLQQQPLLHTGNGVTSAHQQYGQHTGQSGINPYNASSATSSGASFQQQPGFGAGKTIFNQAAINRVGSINQGGFGQGAQTGNQTSGQFHYQQAQFANQLPGQQPFNTLLGADAFKDVVLNIDYGVIEAYNVGIKSARDFTGEQLSGGFDVAKAIFNQADTNRDGGISQDEFRQWAQGGQQNSTGQSYSNYPTTSTNSGNNFNNAQVYANTNPQIANILQQSGLAQGYANY